MVAYRPIDEKFVLKDVVRTTLRNVKLEKYRIIHFS